MHTSNMMSSRRRHRNKRDLWRYRPVLQQLEARELLASDFGDAPLPYPTLLAEGGAEHVAIGPTLGAFRDTEADGVHSAGANGDDIAGSPDDEGGVAFSTIRVGALEATLAVKVPGGSAKLDAWIDFNRDGSWGGPLEQIADSVTVTGLFNTIKFDVPSWAADGTTYARFRLSTLGNLGVGGQAADGEVEDYAVTILPPTKVCPRFKALDISAAADGASSVFAADVDGNGDMDVLSASFNDDKIAWYENVNQVFTAHTIVDLNSGINSADGALSVFAADVDGDGDTDVLSASVLDDKIAWYENINQVFTPRTIVDMNSGTDKADGARRIFAADVDGDGDTDVLSASFYDDKIAWYENINQVFTAHTIVDITSGTDRADGAESVFAADVDRDGDMDVLSASSADHKIAWYKNNGSQNFTKLLVSTTAIGAISVFAAYVDGDDFIDVLSASYFDDKIAWYKNGGDETFGPSIPINSIAADGAISVFAADVYGDGNTDVLSASGMDDKIALYLNDGSANFTPLTIADIITPPRADRALSVFAGDVDKDGDLDVLSASFLDDRIVWYRNCGTKPKPGGGLDGIARDVIAPPLPPPAPPVPPASQPGVIVYRSLAATTEPETLDVRKSPPPIARLSTLKRLADVDWGGILHDDLPLFSEW